MLSPTPLMAMTPGGARHSATADGVGRSARADGPSRATLGERPASAVALGARPSKEISRPSSAGPLRRPSPTGEGVAAMEPSVEAEEEMERPVSRLIKHAARVVAPCPAMPCPIGVL